MLLNIERKMMKQKFVYIINECDYVSGEAKYTYGILPRNITVFDNSNGVVLNLKQTNWLLALINRLPVLNLKIFTPFKFFEDVNYYGKSKTTVFKPVFYFTIKDDIFELRQHTGNYSSLMKNNTQIALYQKCVVTEMERNNYNVKYSSVMNKNISLLLLLCIFIDVVYYPNHFSISYYKREKTFVLKDSFKERISWEPN